MQLLLAKDGLTLANNLPTLLVSLSMTESDSETSSSVAQLEPPSRVAPRRDDEVEEELESSVCVVASPRIPASRDPEQTCGSAAGAIAVVEENSRLNKNVIQSKKSFLHLSLI